SPNAGELVPMAFDTALAGSGIVALSITGDVAGQIFRAVLDKTLEQVQQQLDSGNPHVPGFAIPNSSVRVRAQVVREKQTARNVAAYLPASRASAGSPGDKPWIAVGAHYDHLGRGDHGNSLAGKEEIGRVHFGADDNASGVASVLAIADVLSREPRH